MSCSSFKSPAYNLRPADIVSNIPGLQATSEQGLRTRWEPDGSSFEHAHDVRSPSERAVGKTNDQVDPIFHRKFFTPDSGSTLYVSEYDPESGIAYGFVVGPCSEWGTFNIHQIRSVRGVLSSRRT